MQRKIIEIDEDKCTGCGLCMLDCAEHAIVMRGGKAKVVSDEFCDGLGACLSACPADALRIIEREAAPFDEAAVAARIARQGGGALRPITAARFPGAGLPDSPDFSEAEWPVKLRLTGANFKPVRGRELLVTADCAPVVLPDFRRSYAAGRLVLTACPKFEDKDELARKLAAVLESAAAPSCLILRLEVPCCRALRHIAAEAVALCPLPVALDERVILRSGEPAGSGLAC